MMSAVRDGLRSLLRHPWLSLAGILCLALGIGSATLGFSFFSHVVLRSLPYPEPDRLVLVWNQMTGKNLEKAPSSGQEFEDHRQQGKAFEGVAGFIPWDYNLSGAGGEPLRVAGCRTSASLFPLLGFQPVLGRVYGAEEEKNQDRLALLSYGFWQRRFGGAAEVLGKTVSLDGEPYEILGVLPRDFLFPFVEAEVWVPFTPNPAIPRRVRGVRILGRVRSDLSLEQAQAELDLLAQRFRGAYPDLYPLDSGFGIRLVPLRQEILGDITPLFVALQGAVLLVLLIACANVANLLLVRGASRSKELALRTALGAGPWAIARPLLMEGLLLALPGGVLGWILAFVGMKGLLAWAPSGIPRLGEVSIDLPVAAFAVGVSIFTGLLCSLLPALGTRNLDLTSALKEGGGKGAALAGRGALGQHALVIGEIALAVVVLLGTGLTLRSFQQMLATDPGFRTEDLLTVELNLSSTKYRSPAQRIAFYGSLRSSLEGVAGLEGAAIAANLPPAERLFGGIPQVQGLPEDSGLQAFARYGVVSPGYFEVMEIPLLNGRGFRETDDAEASKVVVVDLALAQRYWRDRNPLGQRLALVGFDPPGTWRTVVGVVGQVRDQGQGTDVTEQLYLPYPQLPSASLELALASVATVTALAPAIRKAVWAVDAAQPVPEIRTMETRLTDSVSRPRFGSLLFALFGATALILVTVGVYGVVAYSVTQRLRDFGLRLALGSSPAGILRLVLKKALALVGAGLALGLVASFLGLRLLGSFLQGLVYGVGAQDPLTLIVVCLALCAVALAASYLPAARAARANPMTVLRAEL